MHRTAAPGSGLHQCRICRDDYVAPVWWEPVDDECWHMLLRCAQCDTYRDVVVSAHVAKAYERDLQAGTDEIVASLERIERERMIAVLLCARSDSERRAESGWTYRRGHQAPSARSAPRQSGGLASIAPNSNRSRCACKP
jgi:hypothetical protein